jgi:hypothetical protein
MNAAFFDSLPVLVTYVGVVLVILVACEIGYQFGKLVQRRTAEVIPAALGPMVGGLLGMLAFVLAMTFSMAASRHDLRRANVIDEANMIGTAYLRSDLLDPQYGTEVKRLLREYVDIRLRGATGSEVKAAIVRSVEIHKLLWEQVSAAALSAPSPNTALMVQATNDIIDMHEKRVSAALHSRIPASIWLSLFAISVLTMMTMGAQTGLLGKRALVAVVPLALAFAALIVLVVELDRPQRGLIKVSQQAMVDLRSGMGDQTE